MAMKQENIKLLDNIAIGVKRAYDKLLEERAANNHSIIISENGVVKSVSAREILEKRREEKK